MYNNFPLHFQGGLTTLLSLVLLLVAILPLSLDTFISFLLVVVVLLSIFLEPILMLSLLLFSSLLVLVLLLLLMLSLCCLVWRPCWGGFWRSSSSSICLLQACIFSKGLDWVENVEQVAFKIFN